MDRVQVLSYGGGSMSMLWTDERIDWTIATLPKGRPANEISTIMSRMRDEYEAELVRLQKEIEALQKDATREYHGSIAPGKEIRLDQFTMWLRSVSLEFEHQASQSPSEWGELQSLHDWVDEIRYMV
jgi:hypothetical protein